MIELVDYNENLLKEKEAKKEGRTRRSRRGGQKAAAASRLLQLSRLKRNFPQLSLRRRPDSPISALRCASPTPPGVPKQYNTDADPTHGSASVVFLMLAKRGATFFLKNSVMAGW